MIKLEKCSICNKKGKEIYKISFSSKKIRNFFFEYYKNLKKVSKFLNQIKKYDYVILKCDECNFIWQKYRLDKKLQSYLYDDLIDYKSSFSKSKKMLFLQRRTIQRDFNFLKKYFFEKKLKVLDYGAGWGNWIFSVKNNSSKFYALELSKKRISFLRKKKISVINFNTLKKLKNKIDFVRVEQVFEHIDDLDETLKNLKKITKKNCIIHISVPNSKSLFKKNFTEHLIKKGPAQPLEHLNSFTPFSLKKLLYKYSFRRISLFSIFKIFLKDFSLDFGNFKSLVKIVYNNFNSTTLIVSKI